MIKRIARRVKAVLGKSMGVMFIYIALINFEQHSFLMVLLILYSGFLLSEESG